LTNLFSSTEYAWVWLFIRIYLGINWVSSGWHKLFEEGWWGTGASVQGFWERAVAIPESGRPAISYDWYRGFLNFMLENDMAPFFGKLVAAGEVLVGVALLLGIFTGIAAFFGALMNWNFMLAGTASTNPVMGIIGIAILAAWKTAGWWGLDRWVLPRVGAPWQPGSFLGGRDLAITGERGENTARETEAWARIAIGGAIHAAALAYMDGPLQLLVSILGIAIIAVTGLGMFYITSSEQRPAMP
jgi:thiosulfate dehydrogenase [quinone] large subunit